MWEIIHIHAITRRRFSYPRKYLAMELGGNPPVSWPGIISTFQNQNRVDQITDKMNIQFRTLIRKSNKKSAHNSDNVVDVLLAELLLCFHVTNVSFNRHSMIRVKGLSLLILIPGLLAYPAQLPDYLVPLDTSQTTTLRVFCFSDPSHEVSFLPDSKCSSSCGYYDNQNSCCKVFQQGETIKCFLSSKKDDYSKLKSLMFDTAYITPQENIQIISDEENSVLTCLEDTKHKQISHLSDSGFYLKYAYLYEGIAREFGTFSTLKSVHLPANQETRTCNQTNYKWEGDYIGEKTIINKNMRQFGVAHEI